MFETYVCQVDSDGLADGGGGGGVWGLTRVSSEHVVDWIRATRQLAGRCLGLDWSYASRVVGASGFDRGFSEAGRKFCRQGGIHLHDECQSLFRRMISLVSRSCRGRIED